MGGETSTNMKKSITLLVVVMLALLITHNVLSASGADTPDCEIDRGPCSRKAGNATVTLDVNPKPVKAMEELVFTVSLENRDAEGVIVELGMPEMYMGRNRVVLKREGPGKYTGKGIIPRCPSGRKLWRATVEIPRADSKEYPQTVKTDFFFNVAY